MLYTAYQAQTDLLSPLRLWAQHQGAALWLRGTEGSWLRQAAAGAQVLARMRLTHSRPAYGIGTVQVAGHEQPVVEERALALPFGTLLLVTNTSNNRTCLVRINDRGPYVAGRMIDLSAAAARAVGIGGVGTVRIDIMKQ